MNKELEAASLLVSLSRSPNGRYPINSTGSSSNDSLVQLSPSEHYLMQYQQHHSLLNRSSSANSLQLPGAAHSGGSLVTPVTHLLPFFQPIGGGGQAAQAQAESHRSLSSTSSVSSTSSSGPSPTPGHQHHHHHHHHHSSRGCTPTNNNTTTTNTSSSAHNISAGGNASGGNVSAHHVQSPFPGSVPILNVERHSPTSNLYAQGATSLAANEHGSHFPWYSLVPFFHGGASESNSELSTSMISMAEGDKNGSVGGGGGGTLYIGMPHESPPHSAPPHLGNRSGGSVFNQFDDDDDEVFLKTTSTTTTTSKSNETLEHLENSRDSHATNDSAFGDLNNNEANDKLKSKKRSKSLSSIKPKKRKYKLCSKSISIANIIFFAQLKPMQNNELLRRAVAKRARRRVRVARITRFGGR